MIELMTELDVQERSVHQHMHRWRGNIKMVISEGNEYDSERLRWGPVLSFSDGGKFVHSIMKEFVVKLRISSC